MLIDLADTLFTTRLQAFGFLSIVKVIMITQMHVPASSYKCFINESGLLSNLKDKIVSFLLLFELN